MSTPQCLLIASLGFLLSSCAFHSKESCGDHLTSGAETAAYSDRSATGLVGRYVYIRRGSTACAVKFTSWCRRGDATAPTVFTNGLETVREEYEVRSQLDGSADFSRPNVAVLRGSLGLSPSGGIGWHGSGSVDNNAGIPCGDFQVLWAGLHTIAFSTKGPLHFSYDAGLEVALTNVSKAGSINFADPRVSWLRLGVGTSFKEVKVASDSLVSD